MIRLNRFRGTLPKVGAKLLPDDVGQVAKNCSLSSGELRPLNSPTFISDLTKAGTKQTIYLYAGSFWFHWITDVDVVRGAIPSDTTERTYWTGDGAYPKVTDSSIATAGGGTNYPTNHYRLGVPAPTNALTFAAGTGGPYDEAEKEARSYVYTYVSGYGEEGPPSPPSNELTVGFDQVGDLSGMDTGPAGAYNIISKRIYRVSTGTAGSDWQFVDEIAVANTTYSDTKTNDQLGSILETTYWDPPPDTMKGIIMLPNGVMAGFDGIDVLLSVPYQPHAYPRDWMQTVNYEVVGLGSFDNNIVVCTKGRPAIITGTHPESMSTAEIPIAQACVSKRSIVSLGALGVAYASPDGIVVIGPSGARVVTEGVLSRDEWQAYTPSSIHAYVHDGQYIAFYDNGTPGALIVDPDGNGIVELDLDAAGGYVDLETDALYLIISDDVYQYDADAAKETMTWRSKVFVDKPRNYSAAQVVGDHPVTFKLYGDGSLIHNQTVLDDKPFRLPAGTLYSDVEVELGGQNTIQEVRIGRMEDMV